jgi:hypothetical protein
MANIPKITGIMFYALLLSLSLYAAAQAEHSPSPSDNMKSDAISQRRDFQSDDDLQRNLKSERSDAEGERTISGELFLIESGHYFVKEKDGKEIRLHTDKTTQMIGNVMKNEYVEAKVNNQDHALSIRSIDKPFR